MDISQVRASRLLSGILCFALPALVACGYRVDLRGESGASEACYGNLGGASFLSEVVGGRTSLNSAGVREPSVGKALTSRATAAGGAGLGNGGLSEAGDGNVGSGGLSEAGDGNVGSGGLSEAGDGDAGSGGLSETGGAGNAEIPSGDPVEILRRFAPTEAEAANQYEAYITTQVGPMTYATEGTGTARTITQTVFVPPNATYDGKGEVLTARGMGDGSQNEEQKPIFLLGPGASLRNVVINPPGCEGVHMMGDNVVENVIWRDIGEDAASVRSYFPGGTILIKNCEAYGAADKVFQFNAPCDVRIEDFTGDVIGSLVCQDGGTDFRLDIDLCNLRVTRVTSAVVQSASQRCFVRYHNLSYEFTGSEDRSDRVFWDLPATNVTEY
ncbi:pectate lyase [Myxococcota bacterium]